jgi:hypothetical protein
VRVFVGKRLVSRGKKRAPPWGVRVSWRKTRIFRRPGRVFPRKTRIFRGCTRVFDAKSHASARETCERVR